MKGTYRYFDAEVKELIEQKMRAIGDAIKLIYGVDVAITAVEGTVPLHNDRVLTDKLIELFSAVRTFLIIWKSVRGYLSN